MCEITKVIKGDTDWKFEVRILNSDKKISLWRENITDMCTVGPNNPLSKSPAGT